MIAAATARKVGRRLAEKLGVAPTREAIAAIPVERLLQAQAELKADLVAHPDPERWGPEVVVSLMLWQPVIDGDVLPARPIDRIVAGAGADVDLMAGANADESRFFLVPGGAIDQITSEALAGVIAAYGLPVESALASYRASHPGAERRRPARGGPERLVLPPSRHPPGRCARAPAPAATYMYEFAWRSPQFGGRLGACHGADIAFVFDTLGQGSEPLAGGDPPPQLARAMHAAWVASPRWGSAGGRSTTSSAGPRCASTRPRRSWTILDRRNGCCGRACGKT